MKYIIFDIDGTLSDTKKVDDQCFIEAFEKTFGVNIQNQNWAELKNVTDWGITEEIIQREFNRIPTRGEYDAMLSNLLALFQIEKERASDRFKEIPGAKQFFRKVNTLPNYQIGIATGAWQDSAKLKLEAIEIDPSNLPFSNSSHYKSREEITLHTIEQLNQRSNLKAEEIIYFGDGAWDFKTCQKLGIRFIGIDVNRDDKLKDLGAKTIFSNYLDPESILFEL